MAWKKTGKIRESTAGRKLSADDVEGGIRRSPAPKGPPGEDTQQLGRNQFEAGDTHQHEGHGQQNGVLHHMAAAGIGTFGISVA